MQYMRDSMVREINIELGGRWICALDGFVSGSAVAGLLEGVVPDVWEGVLDVPEVVSEAAVVVEVPEGEGG